MRTTWWVMVLAALLGLTAGIGSSWHTYAGGSSFGFSKPALTASNAPNRLPGEVPAGRARVQIEGDGVFDFGVMSPDETRAHVFIVRNTGTVPLTLRFLEKSCQCTEARLSRSEIPPGESAEVELSWKPNNYKLEFSQTARFQTNDPSQIELDLKIRGRVQQIVRPVPLAVSLDNVLTQQSRQAEIQVFGYRDDDLCVEQAEFLIEPTAAFFQAAITPLSAETLQRETGCPQRLVGDTHRSAGAALGDVLPAGPFAAESSRSGAHRDPDRRRDRGQCDHRGAGF